MSEAKFYIAHVSRSKDKTLEDVKTHMNHALDWYRVNESFWVLYSNSTAKEWYARLKPVINEDGRTFICALDVSDRSGWMDRKFWDWLNKDRRVK